MTVRTSRAGNVAILTLSKPPFNFFDVPMLTALADALMEIDADRGLRASVLTSDQKAFCAGADFGGDQPDPAAIYDVAARLTRRRKPLVVAVRSAAVGGGLGLALSGDLRVGCPETRFHANFTGIGLSPGFGITLTLGRVIGRQAALDMLLTARRVDGAEALALRLLDRMVEPENVDAAACSLAAAVAANAPRAVSRTRRLLRLDPASFIDATRRELAAQAELFGRPDFAEGVCAAREKRTPAFQDEDEDETGEF